MDVFLVTIGFVIPIILLFGMVIFVQSQKQIQSTVTRMEVATRVVAEDLSSTARDLRLAASQRITMGNTLDRMEAETHVVADNLASSVSRADATIGPEGAAADAALRTGDTAAAITERQQHP
jgi:hypothetical protein